MTDDLLNTVLDIKKSGYCSRCSIGELTFFLDYDGNVLVNDHIILRNQKSGLNCYSQNSNTVYVNGYEFNQEQLKNIDADLTELKTSSDDNSISYTLYLSIGMVVTGYCVFKYYNRNTA